MAGYYALIILVAGITKVLVQYFMKSPKPTQKEVRQQMPVALEAAARELNEETPKMVDEATRLDKVTVSSTNCRPWRAKQISLFSHSARAGGSLMAWDMNQLRAYFVNKMRGAQVCENACISIGNSLCLMYGSKRVPL